MKSIFVWLFVVAVPIWAADPVISSVPGGIVEIPLSPKVASSKLRLMGHRGTLCEKDGEKSLLFPVSLDTKAGDYFVYRRLGGRKEKMFRVRIEEKRYAEQRLIIKNRRKVNPAPRDMRRIGAESKRKRKDKAFRTERIPDIDFIPPVKGEISSPFGLRRFFNGQPRSPHKGIDIAAPEGRAVVAVSDGYVVDAGDFFFSGNLVFIEHGQGLMTLYAHLSRIDVEPGQRVRKGQRIGLVGKTGRVTGPHLHFSVLIDGVYVDPTLFVEGPEDGERGNGEE